MILRRTKSHSTLLLLRNLSTVARPGPSQLSNDRDEAAAVLRIISSSSTVDAMSAALRSSNIFLSTDLIDSVLKLSRFAHSNALRVFDFFNLAASRRGFFHSPFSCDTMLYILARSRHFDLAFNLLDDMRRKDPSRISTRTLMVLLGRVAKVCSVRKTVETFRRFRRFVSSDSPTATFNALLRTLCQEKSMSDARNVYHTLKHEYRPDLQTFNILLSGWKSSEDAEAFLAEMLEFDVKPDIVTYNCLVDVYCKNRNISKAYDVMEKMRNEEIYPDVITYTSLIGGLGLIGQPDKAKDLLKEMKEHGCYPDVAAYNAAIRNFCIAKRLRNGFELMDEMISKKLDPNATTYNIFFRYYYWANDLKSAWKLYDRMRSQGCLANTQSCMFIVRLCKRQEQTVMALELWNDMVEKGFGSFTLVSDVLIDLLCDTGKLDDAEKCLLQMIDRGQKPSNLSFRRVKVLMELANKHDSINNLSQKMAVLLPSTSNSEVENVDCSSEMLSPVT